MIIGISGKAGSGKDTTAHIFQYLDCCKKYEYELNGMSFENWCLYSYRDDLWTVKKFATAVKQVASLLTGIPARDFEWAPVKEMSLGEQWNNMTVRDLLQKIGTDAIRDNVHENAWVNALMSQYKEGDNWLITDVRFPNEANAIEERGGILVRLNRKSDVVINVNHPSETALDDYDKFDFIIENNGTIDELIGSVREMMNLLNIR